MEKEFNIVAILKDKPKDTSLYSPIFGLCELDEVNMKWEKFPISIIYMSQIKHFRKDGRFSLGGECMLFPSMKMRDWSKFAWKKGDVLCCGVDNLCIFKSWANNSYTEFNAMYVTNSYASSTCPTEKWTKESNEVTIKQYISQIEEINGGKLNLSTLTIEHPKQKFKDGDILVAESRFKYIFIHKENRFNNNPTAFYVSFNDGCLSYNNRIAEDKDLEIYGKSLRLATDSEKQQLYDALAKEGKVWNPDTLQVENLPKKCEFKPMGLCLMRDLGDRRWSLCQFGFYLSREESEDGVDYYPYCAVGGNWFHECIPYNKETKHLLGTTDEWKGGEG